MKVADGNAKLGSGCVVVSRPVGDTCPPCPFLGNGCYAESTERQYKNARVAGFSNVITEIGRIRAMIIDAIKRGKSIRWHERGDWFLDGKLDENYVNNVCVACESVINSGYTLPDMWFYTHIYDSTLVNKLSKYMAVYASIHNEDDMQSAKAAGFTLFAWCDSDMKIAPKRPKRKGPKRDQWGKDLPKLVVLAGETFTTCPEIKHGRDFVTCTGTKDSVACRMCVRGIKNVFFACH